MTEPLRTFRWMPIAGRRHAIPGGNVEFGQEITTLAEEDVTMPTRRPTSTAWIWPECPDCAAVAKECIHVALVPRRERPK